MATPMPTAVAFDVDGTLVDSERHGHRVAFNEAFAALELPYVWDEDTYGELLATAGGQERLRAFLEARGHPSAEAEQLATMLHAAKTERFAAMCQDGAIPPRPGARRLLDELDAAGVPVAVATTGSRPWVEPLLDTLFGLERFTLVLTGTEVPDRKPAPDVYVETCRALGLAPEGVVAVEDSANGLVAAHAAGLPCLMVVNDYTRDHDVADAELVVDAFGDPGTATVLHGDAALLDDGAVTAGSLARLVGAGRGAGGDPASRR